MADENRFQLDDRAVRELFSDWDSPVGEYIGALADEAADYARSRAPKATGRLAGSIRVARVHDDSGEIKAAIGAGAHADAPLSRPGWASGYPYAIAFDNSQGFTWNRGHKSTRPLRRFLTGALTYLQGRV